MQISQPSNRISLTNVAVVRLKKGGKRFEIACYPNKVREWRSGTETDLSEVLQIEQVYINVSKGQAAKHDDLAKCFGTDDVQKCVLEVLRKGELQVGEKERANELESLRREVATAVAERCVDPDTQRPHTVTMIEKAMAEVHFAVRTNKSAKSQALDLIRQLQDSKVIPIQRARMRIRLTLPTRDAKRLKEKIMPLATSVEDEDWSDASAEWELVALIDPGSFRIINELLAKECKGGGSRVETLSFAAVEGDERID